jgi:hypothetical protein
VKDLRFWHDAMKKKLAGRSHEIDFEGYFATHSWASTTDVPFIGFPEELLAVCPPTTKFILLRRDFEPWCVCNYVDLSGVAPSRVCDDHVMMNVLLLVFVLTDARIRFRARA